MQKLITLRQVETNNLSIDYLEIPHNKLVVVSGPSGSGKTSLVYQTIAKYAENLFNHGVAIDVFNADSNSYKFEHITGITPVKIIDQKSNRIQRKQTLAQYIGLHDLISMLFINFATPFCSLHQVSLQGISTAELILLLQAKIKLPEEFKIPRAPRFELLVACPLAIDATSQDSLPTLNEIAPLIEQYCKQSQIETLRVKFKHSQNHFWLKFDIYDIQKIIAENPTSLVEELFLLVYTLPINFTNEELSYQVVQSQQQASQLQQKFIGLWSPVDQEVTQFKFAAGCIDPNCQQQISLNSSTFNHLYSKLRCDRCNATGMVDNEPCPNCKGSLLQPSLHQLTIFSYSYLQISQFSAIEFKKWLESVLYTIQQFEPTGFSEDDQQQLLSLQQRISVPLTANKKFSINLSGLTINQLKLLWSIISSIYQELEILNKLELNYLSLWRQIGTMSGGEIQRAKIVSHLNSGLSGITYIFDEPTAGLHPINIKSLIKVLRDLINLGNNVIVVEHDQQLIKAADYLILIDQGKLVFSGEVSQLKNQQNSYCNQLVKYLKHLPTAVASSALSPQSILFAKLYSNNLQHIDILLRYQAINCIVGVSGSGKSTVIETIYHSLNCLLKLSKKNVAARQDIFKRYHLDRVSNYQQIDGVIYARQEKYSDQRSVMRHLEIDILIAELFSAASHQRSRQGQLSADFNADAFLLHRPNSQRCEQCKGTGSVLFDKDLNLSYSCPSCQGKQFNPSVLEVTLSINPYTLGKNIADVMSMRIDAAIEFFTKLTYQSKGLRELIGVLQDLIDFKLDGIKLNTPVSSLSAGEFQRLWLAKELALHKNVKAQFADKKYLLIIDEPSKGLHFTNLIDLKNLINRIKEKGHTILIVEHNIDLIANSDVVIELGPGSGPHGGKVVFSGSAQELVTDVNNKSKTSKFLA